MSGIALLRGTEAGRNGHAGITLRDVESVRGNAARVWKWTHITCGIVGKM
ncbi:MAG: hypothetical protein ABIF82_06790 [Planctomycetota bacterium]